MELGSSGRYRITTKPEESKSTLTFVETWETDSNAKITCEIINPLGRESCEAVLNVKSESSVLHSISDWRMKMYFLLSTTQTIPRT